MSTVIEKIVNASGNQAIAQLNLLLEFVREMSWEDHHAFDERLMIEQGIIENSAAYPQARVEKARQLVSLLERV